MIHLELITLIVIICLALVVGFACGAYFILTHAEYITPDNKDWEDYDD